VRAAIASRHPQRRRYDSALEAQRAGDWSRYGEEIKTLGELLERLARMG